MPTRPCLDCGALTLRTRCAIHEAERQHVRNARRAERYGAEHKAMRRQWLPLVARGTVDCARCDLPIAPGDQWQLDHLDNGTSRPSHRYCNESARGNV